MLLLRMLCLRLQLLRLLLLICRQSEITLLLCCYSDAVASDAVSATTTPNLSTVWDESVTVLLLILLLYYFICMKIIYSLGDIKNTILRNKLKFYHDYDL